MGDPIFEEAKNALEHLSADPKAHALAEERKIWAWNYENQLHHAKKEGLTEGRVEGRVEGRRSLLTNQFIQKFGPLSDVQQERLQNASEMELTRWAERILTKAYHRRSVRLTTHDLEQPSNPTRLDSIRQSATRPGLALIHKDFTQQFGAGSDTSCFWQLANEESP